MKLTRKDVFEYATIACAIACFATFVCVVIVFILTAFGVCEMTQTVFHSWLLAFIQWLILCFLWAAKEDEKHMWDRLNRMNKQLEALGLTSTTKSKESPFPKDSDQCTSSRSKDSFGKVAQ